MLSSVLVGVKFTNARQILPSAQERPKESYAIDFWNPGSLDYVPVFRLNCGFESGEVFGRVGEWGSHPNRLS